MSALCGVFLIWISLRDVFQSVIVPRAVTRRFRISFYLNRLLWHVWPAIGWRIRDDDRREDFFGTYAPFAMITTLALWVFVLIVGYGLLFYAIRGQLQPQPVTIWTAMYFAGTTMLTIGFGDYTGHTGLARLLSLAAGASGLSVVAVTTAYLFAIFGAFQKREAFVSYLGSRSGSPPSGMGLLTIHAFNGILGDLPQLFNQGQQWTSEVMESHLAYPILAYFRSSHDYESWPGALGTLLDAATLLLTTTDDGPHGQARIMYWTGRHLVHDFARYFDLNVHQGVGIERFEFSQARLRLVELGFKLNEEEASWKAFSELRSTYAPGLAAIAAFWKIPPLQWIGDRSLVSVAHLREQLAKSIDEEPRV
ncbi:MAG: potassium channel family protein [Candidatus Eremiobacteraeota bacterium]|nr:potassium channel family protein [Candidatus Eremiobacteraeota bacterium]